MLYLEVAMVSVTYLVTKIYKLYDYMLILLEKTWTDIFLNQ